MFVLLPALIFIIAIEITVFSFFIRMTSSSIYSKLEVIFSNTILGVRWCKHMQHLKVACLGSGAVAAVATRSVQHAAAKRCFKLLGFL